MLLQGLQDVSNSCECLVVAMLLKLIDNFILYRLLIKIMLY